MKTVATSQQVSPESLGHLVGESRGMLISVETASHRYEVFYMLFATLLPMKQLLWADIAHEA
jgi:hypothetical protein